MPAMIYNCWFEDDQPVCSNMSMPVVVSIATVRGHNPTIPIFVLDTSNTKGMSRWGRFPKKLNFQVIQRKRLFEPPMPLTPPKPPSQYVWGVWTRVCSSVWDVWQLGQEIPFDQIIYCDSDIMWLKDVLPLEMAGPNGELDYFYCRQHNTGLWYFDKTSAQAIELFNLWKSYMRLYCVDSDFRLEINNFSKIIDNGVVMIHDEVFFRYIMLKYPEHSHPIPNTENASSCRKVIKQDVKSIHLFNMLWGPNRGRAPLHIAEFHEPLTRALDYQDMRLIFGNVPRDLTARKLWSVHNMDYKDVRSVLSWG